MFGLTRWTPVTPMLREIDDVFGRFFSTPSGEDTQAAWPTWTPAVEGSLEGSEYVIRVALPGVDAKDVDVSITQNELMIKGQRKHQSENKGESYFVRELAYGAFERSFTLPEGVDSAKVHAKYANGMLEVRVPVPVAVTGKKIDIQVEGGPQQKTIKAA